jgi:hypothetical protein
VSYQKGSPAKHCRGIATNYASSQILELHNFTTHALLNPALMSHVSEPSAVREILQGVFIHGIVSLQTPHHYERMGQSASYAFQGVPPHYWIIDVTKSKVYDEVDCQAQLAFAPSSVYRAPVGIFTRIASILSVCSWLIWTTSSWLAG